MSVMLLPKCIVSQMEASKLSNDVIPLPVFIFVKLRQFENAPSPMLITLSDISISSNELQ